MLLQSPRAQAVLFVLLAALPLVVQLSDLDNFTSISVQYFYADSQVPDLLTFLIQDREPGWYKELLRFQDGSTCLSGMSLTWNVFLMPFVKVFGFSARAISVACIFCHLLFAVSLWFLARRCFPRRNAVAFALVFFCTPWYWASIFSDTFMSLSLAMSLLALFLYCRALVQDRPALFAWAGLAMGLCLYGYLVNRIYSMVALVLMVAYVALAWRRWQELGKRRLLALGLFVVTFWAPLQANLADPAHVARHMFHDREMMLGEQYWEDIQQTGPVQTALKNMLEFFTQNEFRLQALELNAVQALLFVLGLVLVIRRRHVPGAVLIICGGAVYLGGSVMSNAWTWTRMGTLTIPFLVICALGLDQVAGWAGKKKTWAPAVVLAAFAALSVSSMFYYFDHPLQRPAPIFEVARAVVARGTPLEVALHTGDEDQAHRERYYLKLALAEAGRMEEARGLRFEEFPNAETMDRVLEQFPQRSVLLRRHLMKNPVMPTVPVKAWRTFGEHYTVYFYAGDKKPRPRPEEGR